jgi:hypothetical protein
MDFQNFMEIFNERSGGEQRPSMRLLKISKSFLEDFTQILKKLFELSQVKIHESSVKALD